MAFRKYAIDFAAISSAPTSLRKVSTDIQPVYPTRAKARKMGT
jgi:hypothetical protein